MKFEHFPINFLLAGLVLTCIIGFAISIGYDYGIPASDIIDSRIPTEAIENQVNQTHTDAEEGWGKSFTSENPQQESGLLVIKSIWGVMKSIWSSFLIIPRLLFGMIQEILGIPPIVTGTIISILVISLIFAMWRVMKGSD